MLMEKGLLILWFTIYTVNRKEKKEILLRCKEKKINEKEKQRNGHGDMKYKLTWRRWPIEC